MTVEVVALALAPAVAIGVVVAAWFLERKTRRARERAMARALVDLRTDLDAAEGSLRTLAETLRSSDQEERP